MSKSGMKFNQRLRSAFVSKKIYMSVNSHKQISHKYLSKCIHFNANRVGALNEVQKHSNEAKKIKKREKGEASRKEEPREKKREKKEKERRDSVFR